MSANVQRYESVMELETSQLLSEYLGQPEKWYVSNNRMAFRYYLAVLALT
jgi:hypothetical protein